jgi:hypothetical protein
MASSGMLRRVALVRTDVSEELSATIIRVTRIGEVRTTLDVTSNRITLRRNTATTDVPSSPILVIPMMEALNSSETSVLTRATRRNIPEDATLLKKLVDDIVVMVFRSHLTSHEVIQIKTPWPLVRKRIIPTKRRPLVDEISMPTFVVSAADTLRSLISIF